MPPNEDHYATFEEISFFKGRLAELSHDSDAVPANVRACEVFLKECHPGGAFAKPVVKETPGGQPAVEPDEENPFAGYRLIG